MKKTVIYSLSILVSFMISNSAWALYFDVIRSDTYISPQELETKCKTLTAASSNKLKSISERLEVLGEYGRVAYNSGSTRVPHLRYEYYCRLNFQTNDPSLRFTAKSAAFITHIARNDWDTACDDAFQEAQANIMSPVSANWKFWTLLQGRGCQVTTVVVEKIERQGDRSQRVL